MAQTPTGTKRKYNTDPKSKVEAGEPWAYNVKFDNKVAKKIIAEQEKTGAEYGFIINQKLKKAYNIKK